MTPKEKSLELIEKYYNVCYSIEQARQCTLIAIDEIINQWEYIHTHIGDLGGELNRILFRVYKISR